MGGRRPERRSSSPMLVNLLLAVLIRGLKRAPRPCHLKAQRSPLSTGVTSQCHSCSSAETDEAASDNYCVIAPAPLSSPPTVGLL